MIKKLAILAIGIFMNAVPVYAETAVSLEAGIEQLAIDISNQMKAKGVRKIAIDDFPDLNGYKSGLGDFISEELVTNFYTQGIGSFEVVERRELARVLKEQKLGGSGLLDKATIAKIGQILGVDAIVTGSVAYLGNTIKVNARMIDVTNAKLFAAASQKIPKDETVNALLGQSAKVSGASGGGGVQIQSQDVKFQNNFVSVTPVSVSKTQNNNQITLGLRFQNLTSETIYLAIKSSDKVYWKPQVSLITNTGEAPYIKKIIGLEVLRTHYSHINKETSYTAIGAGSQSIVTYVFEASNNRIEGDTFTFSSTVYGLFDKGYQAFSIGIPNIKFAQQPD